MSGSHADKMRIVELEAEVKRRGRTCSKLVSQRDRLERILAVERGSESQAPEGWKLDDDGTWYKSAHPCGMDVARRPDCCWGWLHHAKGTPYGTASTALEAMEAADAALGGEE